jgi:hypothetical protein
MGCVHAVPVPVGSQPIIDMHRHTPWPGDPDAAGLTLIRQEMRAHNVVAAALFITDREDVALYPTAERSRLMLSPMFPCPALTADRKWCFTESNGAMPDIAWLDRQLSVGALSGIGELVFNYAGVHPNDPSMAPYWALAARHDVPAFVHSGRGPGEGQGPRRYAGCCPEYQADLGNPELLRPVLEKHRGLRVVLQHVGFDYMDETVAVMRDFPTVYVDMSVLNSIGPRALHDASLRRLVDAGLADRIVLGSDDQDYAPIIERIEGAAFLTPAQKRGIYYYNAARLLRLSRARIAADYAGLHASRGR